ncbi:hypothetical protein B0H13DRAFT_2338650 [Mycena leptocephala]|nr:hypothetical protein B0H13DRAFT_2338650 [Mycena leptocephala]
MAWINLVLIEASLTLVVWSKDKVEDASLLRRHPVTNLPVLSLLDVVVGVDDIEDGWDVLLINFDFFCSLGLHGRLGLRNACLRRRVNAGGVAGTASSALRR